MRKLFALVLLVLTVSVMNAAQPPDYNAPGFNSVLFTDALTNGPTALTFAPDGRLFVAQQNGIVKGFAADGSPLGDFLTVTTDTAGERGLLGITLHPNFTSNGWVYVYYTVPADGETPPFNRVSRFTAATSDPNSSTDDEEVIIDLQPLLNSTTHNAGAIHFGPDGKLYIATGDNRLPETSQSLDNLLGKILRVNADGTIPADNPFYDQTTGKNRAIWALGFRNPFTFAFQAGTGRMYINDVGENAFEEVDEGIAGGNYGWPYFEGNAPGEYEPPDGFSYVPPVITYAHSENNGCSIGGAAFYSGVPSLYPSDFAGDYFYGDFCAGWIRRYDIATDTNTDFVTGLGGYSLANIALSPDGELYYALRGVNEVYRVAYNSLQMVAPAGTITDGYGNPTYRWPAMDGASAYRLAVSDGANRVLIDEVFAADDICTGGQCAVDPTEISEDYRLVNGSYAAYLQYEGGDWAGPFPFILRALPPAAATPNTAATLAAPTITWGLDGTAQTATGFRLYLAPSDDLGATVADVTVSRVAACGSADGTTCSYTVASHIPDDTQYSFWLQSSGPGGAGIWTGENVFMLDAPNPSAPQNLVADPRNGRPIITWDDDPASRWYQIWVGTADAYETAYYRWHENVEICTDGTCSLSLDVVSEDYIAYVRAWGPGGYSTGGTGGWGGPAVFTISDVVAAITTNLTANTSINPPTLNWYGVENGTWYQIWVGTDGDYQTVHQAWYRGAAIGCEAAGEMCMVTLPNLIDTGGYIWYVQSYGPAGLNDNWAVGEPFTIE